MHTSTAASSSKASDVTANSTESSRKDQMKYWTEDKKLSEELAHIMYRGEKAQDKGNTEEALVCYRMVLKEKPDFQPAKVNVRIIEEAKDRESRLAEERKAKQPRKTSPVLLL